MTICELGPSEITHPRLIPPQFVFLCTTFLQRVARVYFAGAMTITRVPNFVPSFRGPTPLLGSFLDEYVPHCRFAVPIPLFFDDLVFCLVFLLSCLRHFRPLRAFFAPGQRSFFFSPGCTVPSNKLPQFWLGFPPPHCISVKAPFFLFPTDSLCSSHGFFLNFRMQKPLALRSPLVFLPAFAFINCALPISLRHFG